MSVKLAHQISRIINTVENSIIEIEWDGKEAYSEKLSRGVYVSNYSQPPPPTVNGQKLKSSICYNWFLFPYFVTS